MVSSLRYPFSIQNNFARFDKDGRVFAIDLFSGQLYSHPTLPKKDTLEKIQRKQCPKCYYYSLPEAVINCSHYIQQGFLHPVRICVVTDYTFIREE